MSRRRRLVRLVLVLTLAAMPLAGCGKKGAPGLPEGEVSTYPHAYPVGAKEQNATPSAPGGANSEQPLVTPTSPDTTQNAKPDK